MHTIKITPTKSTIKLNGVTYTGYLLSKIPNNFCNPQLEDNVGQWFNYKGLTYLAS